MNRIVLIILISIFTSFQEKKGVEVSFINDSQDTFIKMTVETNGNTFSFFDICPGGKTNPIVVDETYWFCHTVVVTQQDTVRFTGFCTVGETLIKDGKLTVSYAIYPKIGKHRLIYANEVFYSGSAKNVGFPKTVWKEKE